MRHNIYKKMPDDNLPEYQKWPTSRAEREELARDVLGRYLTLSHDSVLDTVHKILFEGYRYKSSTARQEQFFAWIGGLSEEEREQTFLFVQEFVAHTIFSILNKIDGTSDSLIEGNSTSEDGVYGDYSDRLHLRLDIYRDTYRNNQEKDLMESLPLSRQDDAEQQDLHDLWFMWLQKYSRWK